MSRAPVRLLEQGDLSHGERALLDAGLSGAPCAYDVDAGAARFRAGLVALAAGGAAATVHGASQGSAAVGGKTLLAHLVVKVLLGVVAGTTLFTGGVVLGTVMARRTAPVAATASPPQTVVPTPAVPRGATSPMAPTDPAAAQAPSPERVPIQAAPGVPTALASVADRSGTEREREVPQAALSTSRRAGVEHGVGSTGVARTASGGSGAGTLAAAGPGSDAAAAPVASTASQATPPSPAEAPAEASDSLSELRALAVARGLVDRDPDAALTALDRMRRDYPKGYFVEERQALMVLALAGAGRASAAHQQAASFLRAFPNGPFSERVRAVLHDN